MGMADKCGNCTDKCPQAEITHQTALGRMYATKEFIELQKKVESGELVEVVRCEDCKDWVKNGQGCGYCKAWEQGRVQDHYCSCGENRNS